MKRKLMTTFFVLVAAVTGLADLPEGYVPVEYVESNGKQTISSFYDVTADTKIVMDFKQLAISGESLIFGKNWAGSSCLFGISGGYFKFWGGNGTAICAASTNTEYVATFQKGSQTIYNKSTEKTSSIAAAFETGTIKFLGNSGNRMSTIRVYGIKIYEGTTLARDLIPCRNPDSQPGLYDLVGDSYYVNNWTGSGYEPLAAGPDVIRTNELEIASSCGDDPGTDPACGAVTGLSSGDTVEMSAPARYDHAGGIYKYTCTGYRMYDLTVDGSGQRVENEVSGSPFSGTSFTYTHGTTMRRVVWQYAMDNPVDPDDFKYCVEFTAPTVSQGTDATQFQNIPVLVRLTDDSTKFAYSKLSDPAGGSDIVFFSSDGMFLPHEIDTWNADGESTVWVKLPELKTGVTFRMYFGCADETKRAEEDPETLWSDYMAVWHMNGAEETLEGTFIPDATGNGFKAKVRDTTVSSAATDGAIGNAYVSDNARYNAKTHATTAGFVVPGTQAYFGTESFTLSCWLKRKEYVAWSGETPFATKATLGATTGGFGFGVVNSQSEMGFYDASGAMVFKAQGPDFRSTSWYNWSFTYTSNALNGGSCTLRYNGGTGYSGTSKNFLPAACDLGIATWPTDSPCYSWYGEVDEVRWTRRVLTAERLTADTAMVKNADYFASAGVSHGDAKIVTLTKYIPELEMDLDLPECHQTYMTDTNYTFVCSATRDRYFTTGDILYECTGCVFTPTVGDPIVRSGTTFVFEPATMGEGVLQWRFEKVGYRARVHQVPPYFADLAEVSFTVDDEANHLFDVFYKSGTELTVTLAEKVEGAFSHWWGTATDVATNKTVTYTVGATANNPDLVPEIRGIASKDDDARLASDNCARTPASRYLYLATTGNDANDGLTAETPVKTLTQAMTLAKAGCAADGAGQIVLVGPGEYSASGVPACTISQPIVFDGGTNNPTFIIPNTYIEFTGWFNLAHEKAAFRRLTLRCAGNGAWNGKRCSVVSVSAGTLESVTATNCFSGTSYNEGLGVIKLSGTGVITNCLVTRCRALTPSTTKATYGVVNMSGGLLAHTRITHCSSEAPGTSAFGGGVYMTGGTVRNCLIDNCTAYTEGSGLYATAGAVCTVENCTIVDCGAVSGSTYDPYAAYLAGGNATTKKVQFVNNIVWGNSGVTAAKADTLNIYRKTAAYAFLYHNLTDAAITEDSTAAGNVAGSPSFTDRANEDYTIGRGLARNAATDLTWAHGAYETDMAGNARILENALDIGCYEYVPSDKLAATITITKPEGFKYGDEVTLACEASGGAGGYSYEWYFGDTLVASGTDATTNVAVRTMGVLDVRCVVTDAALAQVSVVQESAIRLFVTKVYVAATGKHVSPFDSWENAATNFEDAVKILDAEKACEVTVGPGAYVLAKEISLPQKTALVSTDGAAATVLRPMAGVTAFAVTGAGTVIDGFTVEGMSGAARGLSANTTMYMTNVCFRNSGVSVAAFVWAQANARVNTMNLSLNCVTNLGGHLFASEGSDIVDTHRNLRVVDCRAGSRAVYAVTHGFHIYNGLFLRVKTASNLFWSQCGTISIRAYNVTFDDCVCGAVAFDSNVSWNYHYYYNCVIGRIWTTDAKTARRAIMSQSGACVYSSCLPVENPGSGTLDAATITADAKTKTGGYLKCSSPCLRAGNVSYCTANGMTTDIDGRDRFHADTGETTVDMGCFENSISGLMLLVK